MTDLEAAIFDFLNRKYVQRSDDRQKAMGLQYMEAETRDLSVELARFIDRRTDAVITALREIAKGEGEFSRDPLQHASNTIDSMKEIARTALTGHGANV